MAQDEKVSITSMPTSLLCDIVLPAANAWFSPVELTALGEIIRRAKHYDRLRQSEELAKRGDAE